MTLQARAGPIATRLSTVTPTTGETERTMPSCERCWEDSALRRHNGEDGAYSNLVKERGPSGCTPEQQAGTDAKECLICHRMTLHQLCGVCMAGCEPATVQTG